MHADVHIVRTRPPILDVPPLVWIDPPGALKVCTPTSAPLWDWPAPPPRRGWRPVLRIACAVAITLSLVAADAPAGLDILVDEPVRLQLPVPDEPIWCACVWWPSGPAAPLHG
jgi:hypothetical protein